ncbi:MAG: DUF3501 family protein [Nitrospirota bacterium]
MDKIVAQDILPLGEYEKIREDSRRRIWEIKKGRRLLVGDYISILFENRETVIHQIQEMIRAEQIKDPIRLQEEIDAYNSLIPDHGELSSTLFIEIEEQERIKEILDSLMGIDEIGIVYIQIEEKIKIPAIFEKGRSKEDKISAVHYVRFKFNEAEKKAFLDTSIPVYLIIDHPNYKAEAAIGHATRKELGTDLS